MVASVTLGHTAILTLKSLMLRGVSLQIFIYILISNGTLFCASCQIQKRKLKQHMSCVNKMPVQKVVKVLCLIVVYTKGSPVAAHMPNVARQPFMFGLWSHSKLGQF